MTSPLLPNLARLDDAALDALAAAHVQARHTAGDLADPAGVACASHALHAIGRERLVRERTVVPQVERPEFDEHGEPLEPARAA